METINALIVSGCMAVQTFKGHILHEELYHSIIKDYFLRKYNMLIDFDIINYDELCLCYERVVEKFESKPADLIIFQVRGNYYLQMINYLTAGKTIERRRLTKEKQDDTHHNDPDSLHTLKSKIKNGKGLLSVYTWKILSIIKYDIIPNLNYYIGFVSGYESFAKEEYKKLIISVLKYAESKNVPILFLGVTSRLNSKTENLFSRRLNNYAEDIVNSLGGTYIEIFGKFNSNNECKFVNSSSDKISLSNIGHKDVAEKCIISLEKILNK